MDPKVGSNSPLVTCRFCGYDFEETEISDHNARCGQRRWLELNFERKDAAEIRRPPSLALPVPSDSFETGWRRHFARMLLRIFGPEPRRARFADAIRRINEIRDDATFVVCHRALEGTSAVFDPRTLEGLPSGAISSLVATAELLALTAESIEHGLDRLRDLAPMKLLRDLAYLEDAEAGDEIAERIEEKRFLLAEADELELEVAERRAELVQIAERLARIRAGKLSEPVPIREISQGRPVVGRPIAQRPRAPVPLDPETEGDDLAIDPRMVPTEDARGPSFAIDAGTFERLQARATSFSKPRRIGEYRITGLLGAGGMGIVYEARAPSGSRVALKTLRASLDLEPGDDSFARRFLRECRILRRLDHPGCVRLLDFGEDGGETFVVLGLVDGVPLSAILRERRLTLEEAIGLGVELAQALAYLHHAGIVHRDLKPGNIMVTRDGRAVITDFGISRALDDTAITEEGEIAGTPGYVAPEIVLGEAPSFASDQWALGRVLFRAVSGAPEVATKESFRSRLRAGTLVPWDRFPLAREWADLREVLVRALSERSDARYPHVRELSRALAACSSA